MADRIVCLAKNYGKKVVRLPFTAIISACIFLPSQLTVTVLLSLYLKLLPKINLEGAIPVVLSFGKYSNTFD